MLEELKKEVERVEKTRVRLYSISWIDMFNGRRGEERYVEGVKITDGKLLNILADAIDIIHGKSGTRVDFVVVTDKDIIVQWHRDAYNPYGSYVGTTYSYMSLREIIRRLREVKTPNAEELINRLKDAVAQL